LRSGAYRQYVAERKIYPTRLLHKRASYKARRKPGSVVDDYSSIPRIAAWF